MEICLAPLAGVTDWPFRLLCFEQGCDCAYTEMVSAMGWQYAPQQQATRSLLMKAPGEGKLILQLFGKEPEVMARAAQALSRTGDYAGIDLNMGCPAPKVANSGEGSGLMKDLPLAGRIMEQVVKASALPVSVKCRLGWDDSRINVLELAHMAQESGVSLLAVHGRTRQQMYMGQADWDMIARVKQSVRIPVYGNGDIFTPQDAAARIRETGVDGLLIARGAMGNPWLFRQIHQVLRGEDISQPTLQDKVSVMLRHYDMLLQWKPAPVAVGEMRKHIAWYLKGVRGAARLRVQINTM